jgi:hypothetical protein
MGFSPKNPILAGGGPLVGALYRSADPLATMPRERNCYSIQKQLQIGSHDDVWVQFDARWRTPSVYQKVMQCFKSHAPLCFRPLVDGRQDPTRLKKRHELGKQIGGHERDTTFRVQLLERLDDG